MGDNALPAAARLTQVVVVVAVLIETESALLLLVHSIDAPRRMEESSSGRMSRLR